MNGRWRTVRLVALALVEIVALICAIASPEWWPGPGAALSPIGVGIMVGTVMATLAVTEFGLPRRPDGLAVAVAALLGAGFGVPLARSRGSGPGAPSLLPEAAIALAFSLLTGLCLWIQPGEKAVPGITDAGTVPDIRGDEPITDTTDGEPLSTQSPPPPMDVESDVMTDSDDPPQIDWSWVAQMTGPQRGELNAVLQTVFLGRSDFSRFLLWKLDISLDRYASDTLGMEETVHEVIEQARVEGWLATLVAAIDTHRGQNPRMLAWAKKYRREAPAADVGFRHVGRGSTRLTTDQQIKALAQAFHNPTVADAVLQKAGLSRGRRPPWQEGLTPEQYWRQIYELMVAGIVEGDGWRRVLEAAHEKLPGNPNFEV